MRYRGEQEGPCCRKIYDVREAREQMTEPYLEYAKPAPPTFEWRYIRGTGYVSVFVAGWVLFSFCVWLRYGNHAIGRMPELVRARFDALPSAFEITLAFTGLNLLWLVALLYRFHPPFRLAVQYLAIGAMPIVLFFFAEMLFGDFVVS